MTIPNERFYQFNFSSSDIRQFNKIFARLLENSNNSGKIPTFQLVCNNNRVQIRLEAEEKSFAFLAQIIQEIDNFKLSFVSNVEVDSEEEESKVGETNSLPAEETHEDNNTNLEESERKQEVFEDTEMLSDKDLQETTSSNVTSSINLGREGTITKKILTFISSQDTFRVADLNKEFPDCKVQLLQYVLRKAKKENLITMISKGKYKVNH